MINKAYDYYYDKENYTKAFTLFLELANDNNVDAQVMVASMYYDGEGINKNIEKSYYWYKRAADNGHIESSNFYSFYGFENNNIIDGQKYLKKAVDKNHVNAIYNMAIYYLHGSNDYLKNEEKAIELFTKSALLDDMESYFQIWHIIAKRSNKKEAYTYMANKFGLAPCYKLLKYRLYKIWKRMFNKD